MENATRPMDFFAQPVNLFGNGAIRRLLSYLKAVSGRRVLLCTDRGIVKAGIAEEVGNILEKDGKVDLVVFDGVESDPTYECISRGVEVYWGEGCDVIVSLGGGSCHDAAKAIGVMVSHEGRLWEFVGVNKLEKLLPPLVAINTTAGTGSEVTRFSVITHEEKKTKLTIIDWRIVPVIAVNDPSLMVGMTPSLTATTGMDAFTHAVEAYLSRIATPITDALALKAISLIAKYLPKAYANGKDMEARSAMAYAQYLAGLAFNSAGLGAAHAIAHQLGALYHLHHGLCNAIVLPWVLEFNLIACVERLADVALVMGEGDSCKPKRVLAEKAIDAIRTLVHDVGIPERLTDVGVREEHIPVISRQALSDPAISTNPRRASETDISLLLRRAL